MRRLLLPALILLAFPALARPAPAQDFFALTSALVEEGGTLPRAAAGNTRGCNGENISPQLSWSGAPAAARSYAVSLFDPDAPGGGALHWAVLNIPANAYSLPADAGNAGKGALPGIAHNLRNSFGAQGYDGPCPAPGATHHYEFTVYAMPYAQEFYPLSSAGRATLRWLREHALAKATLTVFYKRD